MPNIQNCKRCGKIFNYNGINNICSACIDEDEQEFKIIKDYLYEHPGATIYEVATNLNIPIKKIKTHLREDRLQIVGDTSNLILDCEKCGVAIKSGKFCDGCTKELKNEFKSVNNSALNNNPKQSSDLKYRSLRD